MKLQFGFGLITTGMVIDKCWHRDSERESECGKIVHSNQYIIIISWMQYNSHTLKTNNQLTEFMIGRDQKINFYIKYIFLCYGLELKSPKNREGRKVRHENEDQRQSLITILSLIHYQLYFYQIV